MHFVQKMGLLWISLTYCSYSWNDYDIHCSILCSEVKIEVKTRNSIWLYSNTLILMPLQAFLTVPITASKKGRDFIYRSYGMHNPNDVFFLWCVSIKMIKMMDDKVLLKQEWCSCEKWNCKNSDQKRKKLKQHKTVAWTWILYHQKNGGKKL